MLLCGLKLTHDGSVAVIDGDVLRFSTEMEKLLNHKRYTEIDDSSEISRILHAHDIDPDIVDLYAIDGWGGLNPNALAVQPRLTIGTTHNTLSIRQAGQPSRLSVAAYQESYETSVHAEATFDGLRVGGRSYPYASFLHVAGHIFGAYCTSPFARRGESAYVLVWDGGMLPRLYYFDIQRRAVDSLGPIFMLVGNAYSIFAQHFGPFKVASSFAKDSLSVAGKVMAYIALGKLREEWLPVLDRLYRELNDGSMSFANVLANRFKEAIPESARPDEDVLLTFHVFLERLLTSKLAKKVRSHGTKVRNICLAGGCALNIKWNSAIRASGEFAEVYVPPFPNDSGSAIGAACCARFNRTKEVALEWSVYSGPALLPSTVDDEWSSEECSIDQLARLLHESEQPVVYLDGRAELGPRALGARSILASPRNPRMKDVLNAIKEREHYRPVSPICLESRAPDIFAPGLPDPYMLFDHGVKASWVARIPAVVHLDGTARLQTVNAASAPAIARLLQRYEALSGIPLLCNTSANFRGCGFFPDVASAARWGRVNYIWSEGTLYQRKEPITFAALA